MPQAPEYRSKRLPTNPKRRYKSSHWGHKSVQVMARNEPFDSPLVVMGALVELDVLREVDGKEKTLKFDGSFDPNRNPRYRGSLLAFSPRVDERLYPLLSPRDRAQSKRELIKDGVDWVTLTEAADRIGGRQAEFTYPRVYVQVIGECYNVVYETEKGEPDDPDGGFAEFVHGLGEKSGLHPLLCVDETGRLWFAGGNYWVHDDGIVD